MCNATEGNARTVAYARIWFIITAVFYATAYLPTPWDLIAPLLYPYLPLRGDDNAALVTIQLLPLLTLCWRHHLPLQVCLRNIPAADVAALPNAIFRVILPDTCVLLRWFPSAAPHAGTERYQRPA